MQCLITAMHFFHYFPIFCHVMRNFCRVIPLNNTLVKGGTQFSGCETSLAVCLCNLDRKICFIRNGVYLLKNLSSSCPCSLSALAIKEFQSRQYHMTDSIWPTTYFVRWPTCTLRMTDRPVRSHTLLKVAVEKVLTYWCSHTKKRDAGMYLVHKQ